ARAGFAFGLTVFFDALLAGLAAFFAEAFFAGFFGAVFFAGLAAAFLTGFGAGFFPPFSLFSLARSFWRRARSFCLTTSSTCDIGTHSSSGWRSEGWKTTMR